MDSFRLLKYFTVRSRFDEFLSSHAVAKCVPLVRLPNPTCIHTYIYIYHVLFDSFAVPHIIKQLMCPFVDIVISSYVHYHFKYILSTFQFHLETTKIELVWLNSTAIKIIYFTKWHFILLTSHFSHIRESVQSGGAIRGANHPNKTLPNV